MDGAREKMAVEGRNGWKYVIINQRPREAGLNNGHKSTERLRKNLRFFFTIFFPPYLKDLFSSHMSIIVNKSYCSTQFYLLSS